MFGRSFLSVIRENERKRNAKYFIDFPDRGRIYGNSFTEIIIAARIVPRLVVPYVDKHGVERIVIVYK